MTTPCPITPDEKTGSVAWLSGLTWPASGLTTSADSARTDGVAVCYANSASS